jgi:CHAD domain-containing protein
MDEGQTFNLPDGYDHRQLIDDLTDHFSIKPDRSVSESVVFYDTFDWRLFTESLVLYRAVNKLLLRRLSSADVIQSSNITTQPVFYWDFPEGELKELLSPIIDMRALLELAEVHTRSTAYRILNEDEKTVVRLVFTEIRPSSAEDAPLSDSKVWLKPVRGYSKPFRDLFDQLQGWGLTKTKEDDLFFNAVEAAGKEPGDYSAKLNLQLDPEMRAEEAAKVILSFLLEVIKINEPYVKADVDTEFLHDFRVAVRRTRSALSQIRDVFPPDTTERFKQDFAHVGRLSNRLRDLDVYLLKEDEYRAMLPDVLRNDIEPLFDYLRTKRSGALQEVVDGLNSQQYAQILQDWEAFLNQRSGDSPTGLNGARPIIELARQTIFKRYRRIVKSGQRILENTEDELLHALRIECKKLRYLLEFFTNLFPPKQIATLIKQLKQLQENLGDFNDLCVQEEYLLSVASELPLTDQRSRKTVLAIGSLIGTIDQERQRVKGAFARTFMKFASPSNKKLFKELFA